MIWSAGEQLREIQLSPGVGVVAGSVGGLPEREQRSAGGAGDLDFHPGPVVLAEDRSS